MSAQPVDVLAVMDAAEVRCGPELAAALVEARAAVAELVELGALLVREREAVGGAFTPDWHLFRLALARVQGGAA